jgi:glycosyltransferase involved in cell wall biosynthesis
MEPYKGLDVLLDALALLEGNLGLDVVVAGAGQELDRLQNRLASLPRVSVINRFLTPVEMDGLISSASLLILPYWEASASGILSQAQAVGLPVVASNVGSFGEYIEDGVTGWLVPPGDPAVLADRLAFLALHPDQLHNCRIAIERSVRDYFGSSVVGSRTLEVYKAVLEVTE